MKCNVENMIRKVCMLRYFSEMDKGDFSKLYRGYYEGSLDAAAAMLCVERTDIREISRNILEIGKLQGKGPSEVVLPDGWIRKQIVAAQKERARLDAQRGIPSYVMENF
jgi:hypothetical protein